MSNDTKDSPSQEPTLSYLFRRTPLVIAKNMTLDSMLEDHIALVVRMHQWNLVRSAKALGISRMTLYRYLHKYKIVRHERLEHNHKHALYLTNNNRKRLIYEQATYKKGTKKEIK